MMKLHADCVLLKRILDKKMKRHLADLEEIGSVQTCVSGGDVELVKRYEERLSNLRAEVGISLMREKNYM